MNKPITFNVIRIVTGRKDKPTFGFQPRRAIEYKGEAIGHILGCEVYLYIAVKHGLDEPENTKCLNYVPKLWGVFPNPMTAVSEVKRQSDYIWRNYSLYHTLKTKPSKTGLFYGEETIK